MIVDNFQVKLESALQWELCEIELNSHLEIIIGAKNIVLSYVIQDYTIPDHSEQATWKDSARFAAPHSGNIYMMKKLVVHNIITGNISETSQAYTCIKTKTRKSNGRIDMESLKSRYQNTAMKDMYMNEAKNIGEYFLQERESHEIRKLQWQFTECSERLGIVWPRNAQ